MAPVPSRPSNRQGPVPEEALGSVRTTLRRLEAFDLSSYRQAYVVRRISTRLAATGAGPHDYARSLETDPEERRLLVEALGVNVTSFFRDPEVWLFLEEVALPPLLDEMGAAEEELRGLSLGCAGGQEAYSLAMLLAELTGGDLKAFHVEAWDMDVAALQMAREAWYPHAAVETLAPGALARYFEPEGDGFRVERRLRSRVNVRRHDMLMEEVDGSFEIVMLRNVMIYFDREAKERLLQRVHEALAPRGLLVLGQSETVLGSAEGMFRPLSLRNRVYAKVGT